MTIAQTKLRGAISALALSLSLGAALPAAAQDLTPVTFGNPTSISISLAPLIFARDAGYFEDEGLDVEILEFKGTGVLLPQIVAKRVDIGYPNPDALIISRQPGKEHLPLKFFYDVTRVSGWEFVVPADSDIQTIADLKGKTLGVGAMTWGNIPITTALLSENGVGDDIKMVPVGVGGPAFLALENGTVDALNLFDTQHATMEAAGTEIRRLDMGAKYTGLFSNSFIAHEDTLAEKPEVLAAFGRAFAKATVVCDENPEVCVKTFWEAYPNQKPSEGTEEEKLASNVTVMTSRTAKFSDFQGGEELYGAFPREGWENFIEVLHTGGQLDSTEIDVDSLYTNDLVEQINDFDKAALRSEADAM